MSNILVTNKVFSLEIFYNAFALTNEIFFLLLFFLWNFAMSLTIFFIGIIEELLALFSNNLLSSSILNFKMRFQLSYLFAYV